MLFLRVLKLNMHLLVVLNILRCLIDSGGSDVQNMKFEIKLSYYSLDTLVMYQNNANFSGNNILHLPPSGIAVFF